MGMEFTEAESNMNDLVSEYQYQDATPRTRANLMRRKRRHKFWNLREYAQLLEGCQDHLSCIMTSIKHQSSFKIVSSNFVHHCAMLTHRYHIVNIVLDKFLLAQFSSQNLYFFNNPTDK